MKPTIISIATTLSVSLCVQAATSDIDCFTDLDTNNPTFSISGKAGNYFLELSVYPDFSFSHLINAKVLNNKTCSIKLNGSDYEHATYYWRFRQAGYTNCAAYYTDYEDERTVTFGSKTVSYTQIRDNSAYDDIELPDGDIYTITPVWIRSLKTENYWIEGSPKTWNTNDDTVERNFEWPVHGSVMRNNIVYTPRGGSNFNSAWVVDATGLGLYRFRAGDGASLPPLRIVAPEDYPFRASDENAQANALYQLSEDDEGNIYFTTTTDIVKNDINTLVPIRVYSLDLSDPVAMSDNGGTITARYVETLNFPENARKHSRHHQVAIKGSINGRHIAWVTGSNSNCDSEKKTPETDIYRWTFTAPNATPEVAVSVLKDNHIGGFTPETDYISILSDRLLPITEDTFCYHAIYYDNGNEDYIYYESSPTLCKFVDGDDCQVLSDMRDAYGCHNPERTPRPVGISIFNIESNKILAFGNSNDEGLSTLSLATVNGNALSSCSSQSISATDTPTFKTTIKLTDINTSGFSDRLRQSVDVKFDNDYMLAHVGNGGLAMYAVENMTKTGITTTDQDTVKVEIANGLVNFSSIVTGIKIHDLSGRTVLTQQESSRFISLDDIQRGMYIITADQLAEPVKVVIGER